VNRAIRLRRSCHIANVDMTALDRDLCRLEQPV
jgi:hypothetical protein